MTIAQWLEQSSPPYFDGVLLYKRFHPQGTLLALFESGESSFTRVKLRDELKKLYKPEVVKQSTRVPDVSNIPQKIHPKQPADVLKPIIELKNISFKEMAAVHASLRNLPTDQDRFIAAQRIDELDRMVDHCWDQINFYEANGHLPPDEDLADIKTVGDVVKLAKNVPTYISKINARLLDEKMCDDDRDKYMIKKAKWQVVLSKIERLLNEPVQI
jgi:hypothetical protein